MKYFLLFLLMFGIYTHKTQAQTAKKNELAKAMTDTMKVQLDLNDTQYQQLYDINLDFTGKVQDIKNNGGSKLQKLNKLKTLNKERDASVKNALSKEQYEKYIDLKKDNRTEAKRRFEERKQ